MVFRKVLDTPDDVGMGSRGIVAAENTAWLDLSEPEVQIFPKDRVVMNAIQENEVQRHSPIGEVRRARSANRFYVRAISGVSLKVLEGHE